MRNSTATLAAQAASRRALRPKASMTSTRPRTLEAKWLISMTGDGRARARRMKRSGEEGVAPEAMSMAPAAMTSRAPARGAAASRAGLNSRRNAIWNL